MVIKVREFRGLDIDLSQVELGDVLEVQMQHCGPILLLLAQEPNSCSRHWIYAARHMLQGDTEQRDAIVNANWYQTSWNGHQRVSRASISVYIDLRISLDQPLVCRVEASWENDTKGRPNRRELSRFKSVGGPVLKVVPTTITARTR